MVRKLKTATKDQGGRRREGPDKDKASSVVQMPEEFRFQMISVGIVTAMSKVPIDTLPVELRIKIYELGDVSRITDTDDEEPYVHPGGGRLSCQVF